MIEVLTETAPTPEIIGSKKELIIAGDKGPCGGVNMAIDTTFQVLDLVGGREKVYANNPPVHNDPILKEFEERKLEVEADVDKIPPGSIYLLSAHGTAPSLTETAKEKGLVVVNVECQYVSKVRRRAEDSISKGEYVIYFGASDHPEPRAIIKDLESTGGIKFVNIHNDEIIELPHHMPIRVLNQTTLSTEEIKKRKKSLEEELGREIPNPIGICYATDSRQIAVRNGIFGNPEKPVEALVVVGSTNSHNSKELRKIGSEILGEDHTFLVDKPDELREEWFEEVNRVGFTSGASVIDRFSEPVMAWFKDRGYRIDIESVPSTEKELMFRGPDLTKLKQHLEIKYA